MTETQDKLELQIKSVVNFCNALEEKNPGLTEWFMRQDKYQLSRTLENQIELHLQLDNYVTGIQLIVSLRNCWMKAVEDFKLVHVEGNP